MSENLFERVLAKYVTVAFRFTDTLGSYFQLTDALFARYVQYVFVFHIQGYLQYKGRLAYTGFATYEYE